MSHDLMRYFLASNNISTDDFPLVVLRLDRASIALARIYGHVNLTKAYTMLCLTHIRKVPTSGKVECAKPFNIRASLTFARKFT